MGVPGRGTTRENSGQVYAVGVASKYGDARGQWTGMMGLSSALEGATEDFF